MAKEIERKFLINDPWFLLEEAHTGTKYMQGYITADKNKSVRIRVIGLHAWIAVKSGGTLIRDEYEYQIPVEDGHNLLDLCEGEIILKTRYVIIEKGKKWEIDVFKSPVKYVIAEIELDDENENIVIPSWVDEEVTGNPKYYNVNIAGLVDAK